MKYRPDRISDILFILEVMKELSTNFDDIKELRIQALNHVAEKEFQKGRFKDMRSARETLRDACTRYLDPDVYGIDAFDRLADKWLYRNSHALKEILLKHSKNGHQKNAVLDFFKSN